MDQMFRAYFPKIDLMIALLIGFVSGFCLYLYPINWSETPDGLFHLHRIRSLTDAMTSGVWYPRWFPDFSFGYGYPVLNFYAPAFYYPPAFFHYVGMSLPTSVTLGLSLWFGLAGAAAYKMLRSWVSIRYALIGSLFYLLFPYHLYDLVVRGAMPEFAAFVWPPLIIHFTYRFYRIIADPRMAVALPIELQQYEEMQGKDVQDKDVQDKEDSHLSPPYQILRLIRFIAVRAQQSPAFYFAILSWAGLILTHNLTALMLLVLSLIFIPIFVACSWLRDQWVLSVAPDDTGRVTGSRANPWALSHRLLQWPSVILLPVAGGSLLSAWYVLPILLESRWVGIGASSGSGGYLKHFAEWQTLFAPWLPYIYPAASDPTVPIPGIGWWILVLSLLALGAGSLQTLWQRQMGVVDHTTPEVAGLQIREPNVDHTLPLLWIFVCAAVITLWLSTSASHSFWLATEPIMGKLQFPWRWQTLASLALTGSLCLALQQIFYLCSTIRFSIQDRVGSSPAPGQTTAAETPSAMRQPSLTPGASQPVHAPRTTPKSLLPRLQPRLQHLVSPLIMLGALLCLLPLVIELPRSDSAASADVNMAQMWAFDAELGQVGASWTAEFLPIWVIEQRWAIGREPTDAGLHDPEGLKLVANTSPQKLTLLDEQYLGQRFHVVTEDPTELRLPIFFYPAWRIFANGQQLTPRPSGALGLLAVTLPPGDYELDLRWGATTGVWLGRAITLVGWWLGAMALVLGVRSRMRWEGQRRGISLAWLTITWLAVAWFSGGIVVVASVLVPPTFVSVSSRIIEPAHADFGFVRLVGAVIEADSRTVRPGDLLNVALHWFVTAPPENPYQTFMHVIDSQGRLVAQWDGPAAGIYRPLARWERGQLWRQEEPILLPNDLPSGEYWIRMGLYTPDAPNAPLVPVGELTPYTDIGRFNVYP